MASRPKLRQLIKDIEIAGGEQYILDLIADGVRVRRIAEKFDVSRRMLYFWRDQGGDERKQAWNLAMQISADADLDKVWDQLDALDAPYVDPETGREERRIPNPSEVQLAAARARFSQWLAARKNPAQYGDKTKTEVNLNIGELHLAAVAKAKEAHRLSAPVIEAVVEDEEDETDDYAQIL